MKKQYRLLIETAEWPRGTIAVYRNHEDDYILYINGKRLENDDYIDQLFKEQVENRPTFWELITQEPVEEKVENEYLPFVPKEGEEYYCLDDCGYIVNDTNMGRFQDDLRIQKGVFRTEKAVRMEALRRGSMSKRYKPKSEEEYFYYRFIIGDINNVAWRRDIIDINNFFIGNVHRTEEEAQQWADRYAEAWRVLL